MGENELHCLSDLIGILKHIEFRHIVGFEHTADQRDAEAQDVAGQSRRLRWQGRG